VGRVLSGVDGRHIMFIMKVGLVACQVESHCLNCQRHDELCDYHLPLYRDVILNTAQSSILACLIGRLYQLCCGGGAMRFLGFSILRKAFLYCCHFRLY